MENYLHHAAALVRSADINTFIFKEHFEIVVEFIDLFSTRASSTSRPPLKNLGFQALLSLRAILVLYLIELDIPEEDEDPISILRRVRAVLNYHKLKAELEVHIATLLQLVTPELDLGKRVNSKTAKLLKELDTLEFEEEVNSLSEQNFPMLKELFPTDPFITELYNRHAELINLTTKSAGGTPNGKLGKKAIGTYCAFLERLIFRELPCARGNKLLLAYTPRLKTRGEDHATAAQNAAKNQEMIRDGRFGALYAGIFNGKTCVLQITTLKKFDNLSSGARARFLYILQEMTSLSFRLSGTGILTQLGIRFSERNVTCVYEHISGFLPDLIEQGLNPLQVMAIFYEIAYALETVHRLFLVHGDLNPNNIVITSNINYGRPRNPTQRKAFAAGFRDSFTTVVEEREPGIDNSMYRVKLANLDQIAYLERSTSKTANLRRDWKENIYSSPEVLMNTAKEYMTPVDVYAFGICLLEALTNVVPGGTSRGSRNPRGGKIKKPFRKAVTQIKQVILETESKRSRESLNRKLIDHIVAGNRPNTSGILKCKGFGRLESLIITKLTGIVENCWANENYMRLCAQTLILAFDEVFSEIDVQAKVSRRSVNRSFSKETCTDVLNSIAVQELGAPTRKKSSMFSSARESKVESPDEQVNPDGLAYEEVAVIVDGFLERIEPETQNRAKAMTITNKGLQQLKTQPKEVLLEGLAKQMMRMSLKDADVALSSYFGRGLFEQEDRSRSKTSRMNFKSMSLHPSATKAERKNIKARVNLDFSSTGASRTGAIGLFGMSREVTRSNKGDKKRLRRSRVKKNKPRQLLEYVSPVAHEKEDRGNDILFSPIALADAPTPFSGFMKKNIEPPPLEKLPTRTKKGGKNSRIW